MGLFKKKQNRGKESMGEFWDNWEEELGQDKARIQELKEKRKREANKGSDNK